MKVVLFCGGGEGLRLPNQPDVVPKPMITIGYRPILWHVMRFYAHWGLNDFVLCLGDKADAVKSYFLRYSEALSNDFVLSDGGRNVELLSTDIQDWRITFVNTGLQANIGQRLLAARRYLRHERVFCANYADNMTDAPLPELVADFESRGQGRGVPIGTSAILVPCGPAQAGRPGRSDHRRPRIGSVGERRLLHLPPGDLRLHR